MHLFGVCALLFVCVGCVFFGAFVVLCIVLLLGGVGFAGWLIRVMGWFLVCFVIDCCCV